MPPSDRFIFGRLEPFDYELVARPAGEAPPSVLSFDNLRSARRFLDRVMGDSVSAAVLRRFYLSAISPWPPWNDEQLLNELAWALLEGRVSLLHLLPKVATLAEKTPRRREASVAPTAWFRVRVVDDATGAPISGVELEIKASDGGERSAPTSEEGAVELRGIPPGTCSVTTRLGRARLDETLALVAMGGAESTPKTVPQHRGIPCRFTCIATIEPHRVKSGETLESIASQAGLTWQELAEFNWGTSQPKEVNEHLRDDVGCTRRSRDGRNYVLDTSDAPGVVHVPAPLKQEGLATGQTHTIRVRSISRFQVILEDDSGVRIPGAEFEATLADGSKRRGRLGTGGVAHIQDPPPGEVIVEFLDPDDIQAKVLAGRIRRAFDERDCKPLFQALRQSKTMLQKTVAAYDQYFNDYSGSGLIRDIESELTDPEARSVADVLYAFAELDGNTSSEANRDT